MAGLVSKLSVFIVPLFVYKGKVKKKRKKRIKEFLVFGGWVVAKNTHYSFLFFCRFFGSLEMFSYRGQDFEATMSVLLEDF